MTEHKFTPPRWEPWQVVLVAFAAVVCLILAAWSLRVSPDEINACVAHSNYSEAQCEFELER